MCYDYIQNNATPLHKSRRVAHPPHEYAIPQCMQAPAQLFHKLGKFHKKCGQIVVRLGYVVHSRHFSKGIQVYSVVYMFVHRGKRFNQQ